MKIVVTIIGFGNIGKLIGGLLLTHQQHQFTINIIDNDENVHGAVLDLEHAAELHHHNVSFNNTELFNRSDFIFHCAGASVPKGESRLVTCKASIEITESIFKDFKPAKTPFIIVVANPVEIITFITQQITNLPKSHVMGTGTYLDSIRMNYVIRKTNKDISNIDAILLGEHGSTALLSHQLSTINGLSFDSVFNNDELDRIMEQVKASAHEIKKTQDATIYGVSHCAIQIFELLLSEDGEHIPLSTFIPEHLQSLLGKQQLYLSLYSKVNQQGAQPITNYQPNEDELKSLKQSIDLITSCIPEEYV